MTQDQLLQAAIDLGPLITLILGAILGSLVLCILVVSNFSWKLHQQRMLMIAHTLEHLAKAIHSYEDRNEKSHQRSLEAILAASKALKLTQHTNDKIIDLVDAALGAIR